MVSGLNVQTSCSNLVNLLRNWVEHDFLGPVETLVLTLGQVGQTGSELVKGRECNGMGRVILYSKLNAMSTNSNSHHQYD